MNDRNLNVKEKKCSEMHFCAGFILLLLNGEIFMFSVQQPLTKS
jgi:hypothetical protein